MANVALIFSGQYVKYVSNLRSGLPVGTDLWGHSLKLLMAAVVAGGGVVMALMGFMQSKVSQSLRAWREFILHYSVECGGCAARSLVNWSWNCRC